MKTHTRKTLPAIERELLAALSVLDNAENENTVAQAYIVLKAQLQNYINRSNELRRNYYQQRDTITNQAHQLSNFQLEPPPEPIPNLRQPTINSFPETLNVQNAPDFFFINCSFGKVNIRHIALLDVQAKALYLSGGIIRQLSETDIKKINFHLQLFQQ